MSDLSQILNAIEAGDREAASRLFPLVYDELRRMAAGQMAQESPGQSLEATALVHEAYLRLVDQTNQQQFSNRRHFFGAAAEAMRRILVERARARQSCKRGGGRRRLDLDAQDVTAPERSEDLLALDAALDRLAAAEPQAAELVQLRYFAGRTMTEAAELLQGCWNGSSRDRPATMVCRCSNFERSERFPFGRRSSYFVPPNTAKMLYL